MKRSNCKNNDRLVYINFLGLFARAILNNNAEFGIFGGNMASSKNTSEMCADGLFDMLQIKNILGAEVITDSLKRKMEVSIFSFFPKSSAFSTKKLALVVELKISTISHLKAQFIC